MNSETPAPLLRIVSLTKRFGGFTAVSNVSFTVDQGEIVGLIVLISLARPQGLVGLFSSRKASAR